MLIFIPLLTQHGISMKYFFLMTFLISALLTACNSTEDKSGSDGDNATENANGTDESGAAVETGSAGQNTGAGDQLADDASDYSGPRRYPVKSGIVKYELTGNHSGSEVLYFEDYGMREAKFTKRTITMGGQTQSSSELLLITPEHMYTISLDRKEGIQSRSPFSGDFLAKSGAKNFRELGKMMLEQMGGKIIGTETIAGKECEVWEMKDAGAKSWMWNDIPLKIEAKPMNMSLLSTATSIETDVAIAADKFKVPAGIKISEAQPMPDMPVAPQVTKPGMQTTPMQPR
jgi:hypothetical protein